MASFKLVLEYDGTELAGWQAQGEGRRTVQGELRRALAEIAEGPVRVVGAGRTDAGVHAEGQVAAAWLETRLAPEVLQRALNAKLPRDVAVRLVEPAPAGFHPRRDAREKRYRYQVWNGAAPSPLRARRFHYVREPLATEPMAAAASQLVGTRDFACFQAAGSSVKTTVRTLRRCEVAGASGGEIFFQLAGDGFLRHMVRNVVGTLLELGRGRRAADSIPALLESRDRTLAGPTAPACGLTLAEVIYA